MKPPEAIREELTNKDVDLIHVALGLSGEAGELVDAIKKSVIYRKPLDMVNIVEELGDLEFYMERLRSVLNITREETININMDKLKKRYHSLSYSDEQATQRADKVKV